MVGWIWAQEARLGIRAAAVAARILLEVHLALCVLCARWEFFARSSGLAGRREQPL